jgi:hypothetical protein
MRGTNMDIAHTPNSKDATPLDSFRMKSVDNPGTFLCNTGLLFEINRKVLHPLGLSLGVILDANDHTISFNVWDCRDIPEGLTFTKEAFELGMSKLKKYMEERGNKILSSRKSILGIELQD